MFIWELFELLVKKVTTMDQEIEPVPTRYGLMSHTPFVLSQLLGPAQ